MKKFSLLSSTIIITSSIVYADRGADFDLYTHPLFKQQAVKTNSSYLDPSANSPEVRNSVKWLPQGKVSNLRGQFEEQQEGKPAIQKPISRPSEEASSSILSLFPSLRNVSLSGFWGGLQSEEAQSETKTPAPVVSRQAPQATPPQEQSWGSWAGSLVQSSFSFFIGDWGFAENEEEKSTPVATAQIDELPPEEIEESSSYFTQPYNWGYGTANWLSDAFWGQPKQQPSVDRVSLEEIKGFDTVKLPKGLPKALGAILEGGWDEQDPEVIAALASKLEEADTKYKSPANLQEARKKASFVTGVRAEMNEAWDTFYPQLIRNTRARARAGAR